MANVHIKQFKSILRNRFHNDTTDMTNTEWITENTTLRGRPFSIKGYEFQEQIINDNHPNMDVPKCSQVGLTESQIRKALAFLVRNNGTSAIFTLPNEKMYKRVSSTRVKPLIEEDKVFRAEAGEARSMGLMQFRMSFLYLTGCTEGDATSIPADAVFNDEVDISPQDMLGLFNSRLQNSAFKINQRFSTPTFPAFGISSGFSSSDQHFYLCKCDACNHWNNPEFDRRFVNIPGMPDEIESLTDINQNIIDLLDLEGSYVKCEKCGSALDLGNPENRAWVPKYANRTHARGYFVSPFVTDRLNPMYIVTQLLKYQKNEYVRGFYNTVLGQTYTDNNIQLSRELIEAAMKGEVSIPPAEGEAVWVGIDVGKVCHIVLGCGDDPRLIRAFDYRVVPATELVETVKNICAAYNVKAGAIDRHPYTPTANAVYEASGGRIFPVEYRGTKAVNIIDDELNNMRYVQADRTPLLDRVKNAIAERRMTMTGYGIQKESLITHYRDLIRDEQPEKPAKWIKLTGDDHYFHGTGFMLFAPQILEWEKLNSNHEVRSMFSMGTAVIQPSNDVLFNKSRNKNLDKDSYYDINGLFS